MSVSGLGSSAASLAALMNQRRQSLQTMSSDIQSGDLSGAQQALTSLQTDSSTIQSSDSSTGSSNPYKSTLSTDLSSISSALQSGDTSGAQSALSTFQTDLQTASQGTGGVHHGHHGGGGGGGDMLSSTSSTSATSTAYPSDSSQLDALTTATQSNTGLGASADSSTSDILAQLLSSLDSSTS